MQIAVVVVQPFETNNSFNADSESNWASVPCDRYAMIIIGITISFAGNPKINAIKITPSSPKIRANGSKNDEQILSRLAPSTVMFAISQIISPAGAATAAALPKTNKVLSKIERIITFVNCGLRKEGSSRT